MKKLIWLIAIIWAIIMLTGIFANAQVIKSGKEYNGLITDETIKVVDTLKAFILVSKEQFLSPSEMVISFGNDQSPPGALYGLAYTLKGYIVRQRNFMDNFEYLYANKKPIGNELIIWNHKVWVWKE